MANLPIPDLILENFLQLKPSVLKDKGLRFLLLDLDNTLAPYSEDTPSVALRNWVDGLKKEGIELFILSNNHGKRPKNFAASLKLDYIGRAHKPSVRTLLSVLERKGVSPEEAAIIGDQVYTDILVGKRAGVFTIAVKPISLRNPLHLIRYGLEYPFRRAYGNGKKQK